eukprot:EC798274.1.p3 GENE.EC798274.1~~EC798274.1.p3  ORF type:complete len:88 (-),score=18.25 EC798274.1:155-418(-)
MGFVQAGDELVRSSSKILLRSLSVASRRFSAINSSRSHSSSSTVVVRIEFEQSADLLLLLLAESASELGNVSHVERRGSPVSGSQAE